MGDLGDVLEETIECHKVVKVFGGQDYEERRFERANQRLRGFNMRQTVPAALTTPVTHILAATALAIILYLAIEDSFAAHTTVGEFASFITAMLMLLAPLKHLTEINAPLQRGLAAAESVFGLIDAPAEEDRGTVTLARARGEIAFEDVSFTYPTRNMPALRSVSLAVRPGERVALVGSSGGGKTTLVNLLPRFYAADSGRIMLDGHDLREYDLFELRANIGVIFQDFVRFHMTAAENIAVGRIEARGDRDRIARAAAQSGADQVIAKLPDGYDQVIGKRFKRGIDLSGGEWQKIAIARAYTLSCTPCAEPRVTKMP
jgi:subfamily B ATP-binding cassette protein MsbA